MSPTKDQLDDAFRLAMSLPVERLQEMRDEINRSISAHLACRPSVLPGDQQPSERAPRATS